MEQVRARVEERVRREAAAAAEREREPERAPEPESLRGGAEPERESTLAALPPSESFDFHGHSIYWSSRGGVGQILYGIRRLLRPLLKFVFNIDPMVDALATQARRNAQQAAFDDAVARRVSALEEEHEQSRRAVQELLAETRQLSEETRQLSTETRQLSAEATRLSAETTRLSAETTRLSAEMNKHRKLVGSVVQRLDDLEQAAADEPSALPHDGRPESAPADEGPETPAGGELAAPAAPSPAPPDVEPPPTDR